MIVQIGDIAPDLTAETTEGKIYFHEWIGDGWVLLFSHPKDFTPVCTTELGSLAALKPEFEKRNCKIIGLSVDSVEDHKAWIGDIEDTHGFPVTFPLIGDTDLKIAKRYGMIHPNAQGDSSERNAMDNATVRSVFIIGPDKCVKLMITYPMSTGRNFDEILRVLESCQLTAQHQVATPANWQHGDPVIIVLALTDEEAKEQFPDGWEAPKPYLRYVQQPK